MPWELENWKANRSRMVIGKNQWRRIPIVHGSVQNPKYNNAIWLKAKGNSLGDGVCPPGSYVWLRRIDRKVVWPCLWPSGPIRRQILREAWEWCYLRTELAAVDACRQHTRARSTGRRLRCSSQCVRVRAVWQISATEAGPNFLMPTPASHEEEWRVHREACGRVGLLLIW
jgi:hypothetical protein